MKKNWFDGVDAVNVNLSDSGWAGWLETFVLTAIAVVVSYVTQPADPFRIVSGFPWAMLGPLLVGLRYGFAQGFVSSLLVLACLGVAINQSWQVSSEFPLSWAIGVVVVAMVAGEFRDVWERRLRRLAGMNQYRGERLEEFTRSYHLLRLSHDRLEQTIANSGLSLRDGIMRLQSSLHAVNGFTPESWQKLLDLMAEFGSLEQAGIYAIVDDRPLLEPCYARIGDPFDFAVNDPLIERALEESEMIAINALSSPNAEQSRLLLVCPLRDSGGECHGLLVVRSMPFFSFHDANLKLLSVLCAHGVDHLKSGAATASGTRFILAFERVQDDFQRFRLPSMLIRLNGSHQRMMQAYDHVKQTVRALDMVCVDRENHEVIVWILLPLTDSLGARQWLQRHEEPLHEVHTTTYEVADVDADMIRHLESR